MDIKKRSRLNWKIRYMIIATFIFLFWMLVIVGFLHEIEYILIFSYAVSIDWLIYPVVALYLITVGITLLFLKINILLKFSIGVFTGIIGIGIGYILLFGIVFGFTSEVYQLEETDIVFIKTKGILDFHYNVYEVQSGFLVKPIAELNSWIYPYEIDQTENELNRNELIVKIFDQNLTYDIHIYFEIIDGTYILVDEILVTK